MLLPFTDQLEQVDAECKKILTNDVIQHIVNLIPDEFANWTEDDDTPETIREVYFQFLSERLNQSEIFLNDANHARKKLI